jgi:hypothetical protein
MRCADAGVPLPALSPLFVNRSAQQSYFGRAFIRALIAEHYASVTAAMHSISTRASLGRRATSTAERAGLCGAKNYASEAENVSCGEGEEVWA